MKNKLTIIGTLFLTIIMQSCSVDTPESYFGKTTLNINKYVDLGTVDFQRMIESQSANSLYVQVDGDFVFSDNIEKHIKTYKIFNIETDIENVKKLKSTEETKEMINASLDLYNFIKSRYEIDYIKIAKLIEKKSDRAVIDTAIREFEEKYLEIFRKKRETLYNFAIPYAKANGIEVSFF